MGQSVAALDCDPLGGLDIAFGCGERSVYNIGDAVRGDCALSDSLVTIPLGKTRGRDTAGLLRYAKLGELDGGKLPAVFENLRKRCSLILCDCPAGAVQAELADAADILLLVTNTGDSCNRAAAAIRQELQAKRRLETLLLVNRVDKSLLRKQHSTLDDSIDGVGARLIGWTSEINALQVIIGNWRQRDFNAFRSIAERLQNEV
jgi:septum formation inhibitor-activating ATPase MinD